jgi:hypothetical protein
MISRQKDLRRLSTLIQYTLLFHAGSCPSGWTLGGTSCYKLVLDSFMNWQQANDFCLALDPNQEPHVLRVDSDDKQRMIQKLINQLLPGIFSNS